jgi:hypothetical protein
MSESLLRFLLSELRTIRLRCKGSKDGSPCGSVIELPVTRLAGFFGTQPPVCPFCGAQYGVRNMDGTYRNAFELLAAAMKDLASVADKVEVEFVLPDTGKESN